MTKCHYKVMTKGFLPLNDKRSASILGMLYSEDQFEDLEGFWHQCHTHLQIKEWYNHFNDGYLLVERDSCSGKSLISRNDEFIDYVWTMSYYLKTNGQVWISAGLIHFILSEDLSVGKVSATYVVRFLKMEQQLQLCLQVMQDILNTTNGKFDFQNSVITDESKYYFKPKMLWKNSDN